MAVHLEENEASRNELKHRYTSFKGVSLSDVVY